MARIENWSLNVSLDENEMAPECRIQRLAGQVFDHPHQPDGKEVVTSQITDLDRQGYDWAWTKSGTYYSLGRPDPKWVEFLKQNGFPSGAVLEKKLLANLS